MLDAMTQTRNQRKVYLIPASHGTRDDASSLIGLIEQIGSGNRGLLVLLEMLNREDIRRFLGSIGKLSENQIEMSRSVFRQPDFVMPFYKGLASLIRKGVVKSVHPIDKYLDKELDKNDEFNRKVSFEVTSAENQISEVQSLYSRSISFSQKMKYAKEYAIIQHRISKIREPVMIQNIRRRLDAQNRSVVIHVGEAHEPAIAKGLADYELVIRKPEVPRYYRDRINILFELDSALDSGDEQQIGLVSGKMMLFNEVLRLYRNGSVGESKLKFETELIPKILGISSLDDAKELFDSVRDLAKRT